MSRRSCNARRRGSNETVEVDICFDADPRDYLPDDAFNQPKNACCSWWICIINTLIVVVMLNQLYLWKETTRFTSDQLQNMQFKDQDGVRTHKKNATRFMTNDSLTVNNKTICRKNRIKDMTKTMTRVDDGDSGDFKRVELVKKSDKKNLSVDETALNAIVTEMAGEFDVEYKTIESGKDLVEINRKLMNLEQELTNLKEAVNQSIILRKTDEENQLAKTNEALNTTVIDQRIDVALQKYDADKDGKADFALESAGGSICSTPNTVPYPSKVTYQVFGLLTLHYPSNPRAIIQPGNLPGECFAFYGNKGKIRVKLAQRINISEIALEHTSVAYDNSTMPNTFSVYGANDETGEAEYLLGHFQYKQGGPSLQTFEIHPEKRIKFFEFVELSVTSNYGHSDYTCIYRFRVHGTPMDYKDECPF